MKHQQHAQPTQSHHHCQGIQLTDQERAALSLGIGTYYAIPGFIASRSFAFILQAGLVLGALNTPAVQRGVRSLNEECDDLINPRSNPTFAALLLGFLLCDAAATRFIATLLRGLRVKRPYLLIAGCSAAATWFATASAHNQGSSN